MKKIFLTMAVIIAGYFAYAQNTFPPSGNVGIGTTSPLQLLNINSGATPSASQFRITADGLGSLSALNYSPDNTSIGFDVDYYSGWVARNSSVALLYKIGGLFRILGSAGNTVGGSATLNDFLDINLSSGNVGIGTMSPGERLTVIDAANANIYSGTFGVYAQNLTQGIAIGYAGISKVGSNANGELDINAKGAGNLILQTLANGNVGIGTTNPDQKLTVKGTIHSQEVLVDLNVPGPDYVFEPAYKLPTLSELKTYVDQNHHLPEIPSAGQMAKDGLSLGDMNVKLLKKVEELTLYLIEKDKQLTEQQKVNREQQKKLEQQDQRITALENALRINRK